MIDCAEKLFGLQTPAGKCGVEDGVYPPHNLVSTASLNLWYCQRYAAAIGVPQPSPLSVCAFGIMPVDTELLLSITPRLRVDMAQLFSCWISIYTFKYGINTIPCLSAFLANTAEESSDYVNLSEDLYYTADVLLKDFPHEFKSPTIAQEYAEKPEAIANRAYANRMGNGPESSGDGWRFRGRGIMQVTGKSNYSAFKKFSGIDVVSNPDLMAQPQCAVLSAIWFWQKHNLNQYADSYQFESLAGKINGKIPPRGWSTRELNQRTVAKTIAKRFLQNAHCV